MENITQLLIDASGATSQIRSLSAEKKQQVLEQLALRLEENIAIIIIENKKDLDRMDDDDPKKDRLLLNEERILELAASVREVAVLEDPTNKVISEKTLANGLFIQKKSVALGVVGVIYEARPNVTVDVAALCIRSGNVCVLRGGSDADDTNKILVGIIQETLVQFGLNKNIVQLLPIDRKFVEELLTADKYVDILIPRGSQSLIDFVRKNAKVPVIETGAGVCHTYVESSANLEDAAKIIRNAKVTRPSVCNALDTVLIDQSIAEDFIPMMAKLLKEDQVEIFADDVSYQLLKKIDYPLINKAEEEDFGREFLSLKCSVKIVNGIDEALSHIKKYSSKHSEAIVCENAFKIERFLNEVDAAAVYANASTRFTDGGVFGLGAEIGISTQKLHARGPFALEKLVTEKWIVKGNGQVR
ncbi:gamma-glutamyl-phosphate reductase [Pedobacter psychrophilus]|uniref:Gamma-glutamyl phosphate reductase n=1 Tax=Pedobacter psychrophilus TaxID=1826909 RepID=A0A179DML4_9SPHI|nr:glutamate-5-semialdehyde dehydrogenase [Pedobacter psychrophilus]OAQ42297.1 gamma-glutamyl-phosphate reductase [Pedobacter psychrophilus]